MLTELFPDTLLDRSTGIVVELNVCRTRRCRTFGTKIGWIVKTFDYINRVNLTRPLLVYEGTWTHSPPLIAMHLLDRSCVSVGIFLKFHAMFPNSGFRARSMCRWYARVQHKEFWAVIVILLTTNVLFWFSGIFGWSCPDQPYMTMFMRPVPPTDMQLVLHKGSWRVSISPILVESNLTVAGPCEG